MPAHPTMSQSLKPRMMGRKVGGGRRGRSWKPEMVEKVLFCSGVARLGLLTASPRLPAQLCSPGWGPGLGPGPAPVHAMGSP